MLRTLLFATLLAVPAVAIAEPPAKFVTDAVRGNYSEATLGRMIQARGSTAHVRQFGAMLVSDHMKGLSQSQAVARHMNMRVPLKMMPEAAHAQMLLRKLRGAAFDREVRRYMIDDHTKDIAEYRDQVRTGNRWTIGYAAATIPALQRHLAMARSIRA